MTTPPKAPPRPNLVFVFPDQYRAQAMGFLGEDPVLTPHLDRFAAESLHLPNAAANHPLCSPYRAMLMTGKYPFANRVLCNCCSAFTKFGFYLRESERCFSDGLRDAGYSLGYVGKWHLDPPDAPDVDDWRHAVWDAYTPPGPRRHGFDFWHSYGAMNNHLNPHYWIGSAREEEKQTFKEWSPEHEANVSIDYLRNRDGKQRADGRPFALFVSMNPPHPPYQLVPEKYTQMYAGKTHQNLLNRPNVRLNGEGAMAKDVVRDYFAAITGVDEQFGRILRCLKEEGLEDNTIVVFTADHGEMMGSQGRMYKNLWYEESLLVPFLIRWPGRIRPGRDDLHLGAPDLMPTLMNLMGCGAQVSAGIEGSDYSAAMLGNPVHRPSSAFYMNPIPHRTDLGARGVRTHRCTFVIERDENGGERTILHDNQADRFQLKDIAAENPGAVKELTRELTHWLERTGDPWRRS